MVVRQSNGYFPILVSRKEHRLLLQEGTWLGRARDGGKQVVQPTQERALLVGMFREAHRRYLEEDVDTLVEEGPGSGIRLVVKGRRNGNAGDWYLTESSGRLRILEGSRYLDEIANALEQV